MACGCKKHKQATSTTKQVVKHVQPRKPVATTQATTTKRIVHKRPL